MAKPATFFAIFPVNKHSSTSEVICRYRSTYEGCDLVPLVTSSVGDSEVIIHFKKQMQGSFQIAITSRVFSQTRFLKDQRTRELFVQKYILKVFNQSRETIVD